MYKPFEVPHAIKQVPNHNLVIYMYIYIYSVLYLELHLKRKEDNLAISNWKNISAYKSAQSYNYQG